MRNWLLAVLLSAINSLAFAQTYQQEWIHYDLTYYKFYVGTDGLYRIPYATLAASGLGQVPSEQFQLWKNGQEVPVYVSTSSGLLGSDDFIEFYGTQNDGTTDTKLYRADSLQMNTRWSLYSDTAAYFLTVNASGTNKRITALTNDLSGNSLSPEPYFMHTLQKFFKLRMNAGYGVDLGELVHAASYESGEGWTSNPVVSGGTLTEINNSLQVNASGGNATLKVTLAGNTPGSRSVVIKLNDAVVATRGVSGFDIARIQVNNIAASALSGDVAKIAVSHNGSNDNVVVADYQLTYPRHFRFGNQSLFYFEMPGGASRYIEVSAFAAGGTLPVLLDLNNNSRQVADTLNGLYRFLLPVSADIRKLVLVSTAANAVKQINELEPRQFTDYSQPQHQGNYLIISHPVLYDDGAGINQVEAYRQYRQSVAGGGFNAQIVDVRDLIDQFGYGVKHHPLAVRYFIQYALDHFTQQPQYVFLIGKGLKYGEFRANEADRNTSRLALIPTFGHPASDHMLAATRTGFYQQVPIGRLSAITGAEVGVYLRKVKEYELAQQTPSAAVTDKAWTKNIAHLTGGLSDVNLEAQISSYMAGYQQTASDTLFGANVYSFSKNSGLNTALGTNVTLDSLINHGVSVLNYFGHSSPNNIEFNLDNPQGYNNTGKYPLILINGCNSGDLYEFDTLRAISKGTLSEKFVLADQKGSIGYIASTHFGLPIQLNFFNTQFYKNFSRDHYGASLGQLMRFSMMDVNSLYPGDYIAQTHIEEINLHGDPAVRLNPHQKPDYVIDSTMIRFNPDPVSMADYQMTVAVHIQNIGKASGDSVTVLIERIRSDESRQVLTSVQLPAIRNEDSVVLHIPLNPLNDRGTTRIHVSIDPDQRIDELFENNNEVERSFTMLEHVIRPVYPYQFAVIHDPNTVFAASIANPSAASTRYKFQIDTTLRFNSPVFYEEVVYAAGGVVRIKPSMHLMDSTVYYWRVTADSSETVAFWNSSSFTFIEAAADGFGQADYYQFAENSFDGIALDTSSQQFGFRNKNRKLLIRTGLYPYYDWDQINVNVDNEQIEEYGCRYRSIQIMVYDSLSMRPWVNTNSGGSGMYGSWPVCGGSSRNSFEFPYYDSAYRRKAAEFLNSIPDGMYISISNLGWIYNTDYFIDKWKADTVRTGAGKSLWHRFHQLGFHQIDSFTRNIPFLFVCRKGDSTRFAPRQFVGTSDNSYIAESLFIEGRETEGAYLTPWMGPSYNWLNFQWDTLSSGNNTSGLNQRIEILGRDFEGNEQILSTIYSSKDTSLNFIDAFEYPYLRFRMYNQNFQKGNTSQLKYWMLGSDHVPEGAIAPNIYFSKPDSIYAGDPFTLKVAFANVSAYSFDSLMVRLNVRDATGMVTTYYNRMDGSRYDPLQPGDSVILQFDLIAPDAIGNCALELEVNPDNNQPEMHHFNNFLFTQVYVKNPPGCPGQNFSFELPAQPAGSRFAWQVFSGNGFEDIIPDSRYEGINTEVLGVLNPRTNTYGTRYRCRIEVPGETSPRYSEEYVLRFRLIWNGQSDQDWANPDNWTCGVLPDQYTDIEVPRVGLSFPIIRSGVTGACRELRLLPGSTLEVHPDGRIEIYGPNMR